MAFYDAFPMQSGCTRLFSCDSADRSGTVNIQYLQRIFCAVLWHEYACTVGIRIGVDPNHQRVMSDFFHLVQFAATARKTFMVQPFGAALLYRRGDPYEYEKYLTERYKI